MRPLLGISLHPDVACVPVRRAQRHGTLGIDRHGKAARHDFVAVCGARHEAAHGERPAFERAVMIGRRRAEAAVLLGNQRLPVQFDLSKQEFAFRLRHGSRVLAECSLPRPAGAFLSLAHDKIIELGEYFLARRRITEPAARRIGYFEIFTQKLLGERSEIGAEAPVLDQC